MTLRKILSALDYVESVSDETETNDSPETSEGDGKDDFFAAAGIWRDRDVTLDSLRLKEWPRQIESK